MLSQAVREECCIVSHTNFALAFLLLEPKGSQGLLHFELIHVNVNTDHTWVKRRLMLFEGVSVYAEKLLSGHCSWQFWRFLNYLQCVSKENRLDLTFNY